jgi:uncharacterized membrane protein YtjA (UPF0391 family)
MLSWAVTFLVIGLIAGVFGLSGIAGARGFSSSFSLLCLS